MYFSSFHPVHNLKTYESSWTGNEFTLCDRSVLDLENKVHGILLESANDESR